MPLHWSPQQVLHNRVKDIIDEFKDKHLPWCVFKEPFETSECNCHSPNRDVYLDVYARSIIEKQDEIAKKLGESYNVI